MTDEIAWSKTSQETLEWIQSKRERGHKFFTVGEIAMFANLTRTQATNHLERFKRNGAHIAQYNGDVWVLK